MLDFYKFRKNIWLNFYIVVEYNNKGLKFMEQYIFPAVFFQEEGEDDYTVVFPDLNIFTDGKSLVEAFLFAKDYLKVYCTYAKKYELDIPTPSKLTDIIARFPKAICMLVDALIPEVVE